MRVLEQSERNIPCNTKAIQGEKMCNWVVELRDEKLHRVAQQIIEISHDLGVEPEVGLGYFSALDWAEMADGKLGNAKIRKVIAYAGGVT